ncbi:MAG: hypothetical protein GF331_04880 [Chitinivibrionales bacterium]|nr:hypothetical protein [Chitinivibrionales bacterium]
MDWKLFASTFGLILLAELGDKTQLAAFAATAGSKSPLSIFLGASAALVLSTLIAVAVGASLQRFVPTHYLKIGAGILFVTFGVVLLLSAKPKAAAAVERPPASVRPGALTRLVLTTAAEFERASMADYRAMAAAVDDPALRALLDTLASEEDTHLRAVHNAMKDHGDTTLQLPSIGSVEAMNPTLKRINRATAEVLEQAIGHEEATAAFYAELAKDAPLPALKQAFGRLAEEERSHAMRLRRHGTAESTR